MPVRCQIHVHGSELLIYRHDDGYPDTRHGVIALLRATVQPYLLYRGLEGFRECFLSAVILHAMVEVHHREATRMTARRRVTHPNSPVDFSEHKLIGVGVEPGDVSSRLHSDINYFYVVDEYGVAVYVPGEGFEFEPTRKNLNFRHKYTWRPAKPKNVNRVRSPRRPGAARPDPHQVEQRSIQL